MKQLYFRVLAFIMVAWSSVSRLLAQVAIQEDPDLSTEHLTADEYYRDYQEKVVESVEQSVTEQYKHYIIIGVVVLVIAMLVVVLIDKRKPRHHRKRYW